MREILVRHALHSLFALQRQTTPTVYQVKKYFPEGNEPTVLCTTQLVDKLRVCKPAFNCLSSAFQTLLIIYANAEASSFVAPRQ